MRAHVWATLVLAVAVLPGCADNTFSGDIGSGSITGPGASLTLQLSRDSVSLAAGSVDTLRVTLSNGDDPSTLGTVVWQSSDNRIATVSIKGEVKGVAPGSATVSAVVGATSARAKVTVTSSGTTPPLDTTVVTPPSNIIAPVLPQVAVDVSMPAVTGQSIRVNAGGDLQAALDAAQPGDEIVVQAGATFTGSFTLPVKSGSGWIIVRSSGALPAVGTRVGPSDAAQMPKLVAPFATDPVIKTAAGAHHYRLVGLEITATAGATQAGALVALGDGSGAQNTVAQVPHDLVLDRVYVHGTSTLNFQRCIGLNSAATAIVDSYISECHGKGFDSQAIAGWNGPGPYKIVNNRLEGAGENVMFGGADPAIPNLTPSDIELRHNHIIKPLSWQGVWSAKNLLELKHAQRVLIEGNVFENSWADAQVGFAIVFWSVNQNGGCNWCVTQDVTFRSNEIRNSAGGFQLTDRYGATAALPMQRVAILHTVAQGIGASGLGSNGRMFQLLGAIQDLHLVHNTGLSPEHGLLFGSTPAVPLPGLVVRDNIFGGGSSQMFSSYGSGLAAWQQFAGPGSSFLGNVVVGAGTLALPPGNFTTIDVSGVGFVQPVTDLRLQPSSPFAGRASDGTNPGADFARVSALARQAVAQQWPK